MTRNIQPAIALIKRFEGIDDGDPNTVNLDPYLCPAGYWTIGWGHVVRDASGRMLKGAGEAHRAKAIYPIGITPMRADVLLADDVARFNADLTRILADVHVLHERETAVNETLNDNQYCALLSFVFNVGIGAFIRSTLFTRLLERNHADVPRQLRRWTRGGGKVLPGLRRRRMAEAKLWLTPVEEQLRVPSAPCDPANERA